MPLVKHSVIVKRVENYLRNSSTGARLSSLTSFNADEEILLSDENFADVIREFSSKKARIVHLLLP